MLWVVFGTYDVTNHPRVAALIEGLRANGDVVTEINEPLRLDTAGRVAMVRQPWRLPIFIAKILRCWIALSPQAEGVRRSRPDAVLVGYLGHFDVRLARRMFRDTTIVLDHLVSAAGAVHDRGLAGPGRLKGRLMQAIDNGALRRADVVVVDTHEHLAALPAVAAAKAVVAPVGAVQEWFEQGRARLVKYSDQLISSRPAGNLGYGAGPLRVVFVGVYTPLHGTRTIGEALGLLADDDIEFTMVGTGQEYAVCRAAAAGNMRTRWVDWVPGSRLPAFVAGHDVSLGIFGTTAKALRVVPTKVYQGAAAACAIVTSDTPPQREALAESAVLVPPGDPRALAQALRELATDRARVARLGVAVHELAGNRFTPAAVTEPIRRSLARLATVREACGTEHPAA